ncbi:hypothetical protein RB213_010742 [Colletotrichum asianum]
MGRHRYIHRTRYQLQAFRWAFPTSTLTRRCGPFSPFRTYDGPSAIRLIFNVHGYQLVFEMRAVH